MSWFVNRFCYFTLGLVLLFDQQLQIIVLIVLIVSKAKKDKKLLISECFALSILKTKNWQRLANNNNTVCFYYFVRFNQSIIN